MTAHFSNMGRIDTVITYNDIKAKRDEVKASRNAYVQKVRDVAKKLVDTYTQSLQLPSEQWSDIRGEKHPYVYIRDGEFGVLPENLVIDACQGTSFELVTVIDPDPREPQVEKLQVSINVTNANKIEVMVMGHRTETFAPVDSDEKVDLICDFIKDSILLLMDEAPCGAQKRDDTVKLWD